MLRIRWILPLLILTLAACRKEKPNLSSDISRTWATETGDTLRLNPSNTTYSFSVNEETETGRWSLNGIILELHPSKQSTATADSLVLNEMPESAEVSLYSGDSLIGTIRGGSVITARQPEKFVVAWVDKGQLLLKNKGATHSFTRVKSATPQSGFSLSSILRGLLGLFTLICIAWIFSRNRKAINWGLVGKGLLLQIIFAVAILKIEFVKSAFDVVSRFFVEVLAFTREGSQFVFGGLVSDMNSFGFIFAFQVLPTIIFFSSLTSLLFYLGILQKIVYGFAWVMKRLMRLSGAESLAAAGNIFLGQTEAPLLVKPYIGKMTRSELLCLMSGGMATIAGGVLAAYIGFLGGNDPEQELFFARHLLAASVMSAPAAVVAAKILLPETEPINESLEVSNEKIGSNLLEAITNGATEGLKLAVNVGAMLIVFIAMIAMVNFFLQDMLGEWTGWNEKIAAFTSSQYQGLNLQFILGYTLRPIAWLMGTTWQDSALVGQLLGEKTILNEFVAYVTLGEMKNSGIFTDQRSIIIATYMLCGFSNFSSIGIQIGGIGVLAPEKKSVLSSLGMRALLGGTLACLFTAVIAGMFY